MTKAKRMMQENLKLIDLIIELVDARIPYSSKNPDIDALANGKSRIILLNKADLSDSSENKRWLEYYSSRGFFVLEIDSKAGNNIKRVMNVVNEACREKRERDKKRGIINRPVRAMVAGIPNVGKSTFINSFARKSVAKTGNKPGVTRGKQWIRLSNELELLDTPGILWPKFDDKKIGMRLAFIGSINDDIIVSEELSLELLDYLKEYYPECIEVRYDVNADKVSSSILEGIAKSRGCLKAGGEYDIRKAADILLDDFRTGKLGKITLERPQFE